MKSRLLLFAALVVHGLWGTQARAQWSVAELRVRASCLLVLGRMPSPEETVALTGPTGVETSAKDLFVLLRERLAAQPLLAREVAAKAFQDAFGRPAAKGEAEFGPDLPLTYAELVLHHRSRIGTCPDEHRAVIERAYQLVLHRSAHDIEVAYWRAREVLPFTLLVACIENWARRNAPGLTATSGTPCVSVDSAFLACVRLPPVLAEEIRTAVGWTADQPQAWRTALGRHVLAPGADTVASVGGVHFVAAGRPGLVLSQP